MRQAMLSGMQAEIGRLGRLLDDLTQLHDRVVGTLEVKRRPVFLDQWLTGVLGPWREVAQAQGLNWQVALPADLPVLEMDADRMAQVLGNLLSNAIKFTPAGDTVSVAAGVQDQQVWIQVRDTGPGIPAAEQPRVFRPFFRGRSGHRFPQGMGLGLSIARDLVEAHDGQLDMMSAPGQGSCFTIWLPCQAG
jgi:signal transduction histidine kinase